MEPTLLNLRHFSRSERELLSTFLILKAADHVTHQSDTLLRFRKENLSKAVKTLTVAANFWLFSFTLANIQPPSSDFKP